MICQKERNKLLAAKALYADGTITQELLYSVAEEYRQALLAARHDGVKVDGKPLWVPSTAHRLICITGELRTESP